MTFRYLFVIKDENIFLAIVKNAQTLLKQEKKNFTNGPKPYFKIFKEKIIKD